MFMCTVSPTGPEPKKTGQHGTVLLVSSTTFGNGNTKITVVMRTELN